MTHRKDVLPNGISIVTEVMPHVRSVAVGIWVDTGSRVEPEERGGISHLIEHLVFKGTETRSAEDIARAIDSVGGQMDAFTAKEQTCFYVSVLDEHLPLAVDLLADMLRHPRFTPEDIEKEKAVVFQEIKMVEDTADDLIHDLFAERFWTGHPLGRPILGRWNVVQGFDRADGPASPARGVRAGQDHDRRRRAHGARARRGSVRGPLRGVRPPRAPTRADASDAPCLRGRGAEAARASAPRDGLPGHRRCVAGALRALSPQRRHRAAACPRGSSRRSASVRGSRTPFIPASSPTVTAGSSTSMRGRMRANFGKVVKALMKEAEAPEEGRDQRRTSSAGPRTISRATSCCRSSRPPPG